MLGYPGGDMIEKPDPDSPETFKSPYVPHVAHTGISWLIRDPEFPNRALICKMSEHTIPRRVPVEVEIFYDYDATVTKTNAISPQRPFLFGVLHPTNRFGKGASL